MSVRKQYTCDLCGSLILPGQLGDIGIRWDGLNGKISSTTIGQSEHHICNKCCNGLQEMFADLRCTAAIRQAVDAS